MTTATDPHPPRPSAGFFRNWKSCSWSSGRPAPASWPSLHARCAPATVLPACRPIHRPKSQQHLLPWMPNRGTSSFAASGDWCSSRHSRTSRRAKAGGPPSPSPGYCESEEGPSRHWSPPACHRDDVALFPTGRLVRGPETALIPGPPFRVLCPLNQDYTSNPINLATVAVLAVVSCFGCWRSGAAGEEIETRIEARPSFTPPYGGLPLHRVSSSWPSCCIRCQLHP